MVKSKTAIVTGGSGGIGSAIVRALFGEGYNVTIHYLSNSEKANNLKKELENGTESKILVFKADISKHHEVKNLIKKTRDKFHGLDIIVNNAGISRVGLVEYLSSEDWKKVLETNLDSAFYVSKEAIPYLKESGSGSIININSMTGFKPDKGLAAYAASKAGLTGLTKTLAVELARYNITVNEISPGYIDAGMLNTVPAEIKEKLVATVPLKRLGSPTDIANTVIFLTSNAARYITGQTLHVNGGTYI